MPLPLSYRSVISPLGELYLAATEEGLCRVGWCVPEEVFAAELEERWDQPAQRERGDGGGATGEAARQLDEYFRGQRQRFELPLDLSRLRPFQRGVLLALTQVPYGEVVSYGELAILSGHPGAARAVGGAMRGNPLPIVIPCHRVLLSSGGLGGFGGRPDLKRRLLEIEGWSRAAIG
jgi:methylated-DNA-[protein]-cysteine S-methyltransferase